MYVDVGREVEVDEDDWPCRLVGRAEDRESIKR